MLTAPFEDAAVNVVRSCRQLVCGLLAQLSSRSAYLACRIGRFDPPRGRRRAAHALLRASAVGASHCRRVPPCGPSPDLRFRSIELASHHDASRSAHCTSAASCCFARASTCRRTPPAVGAVVVWFHAASRPRSSCDISRGDSSRWLCLVTWRLKRFASRVDDSQQLRSCRAFRSGPGRFRIYSLARSRRPAFPKSRACRSR